MVRLEKSQNNSQKKYLLFGFGNYRGQPIQQIGGGYVRDPSLLEKLYETPKMEHQEVPYFIFVAVGFVVLTLFGMLVAWMISLFVG